jgi:hypothetical protein
VSILDDVRRKYPVKTDDEPSVSFGSPTDSHLKISPAKLQTATEGTDKTDKRPSVSSVSEWSELLENKKGELAPEEVPVAIEMVEIVKMRRQGRVPDHYTATTVCCHCGTVPIWEGGPPKVLGCPWCFNRIKGLPIPGTNE